MFQPKMNQETKKMLQKPDCEEKENKPRLETLQTAANQAGQFRLKPANHQAQALSFT